MLPSDDGFENYSLIRNHTIYHILTYKASDFLLEFSILISDFLLKLCRETIIERRIKDNATNKTAIMVCLI